jgi:hypothetical protein
LIKKIKSDTKFFAKKTFFNLKTLFLKINLKHAHRVLILYDILLPIFRGKKERRKTHSHQKPYILYLEKKREEKKKEENNTLTSKALGNHRSNPMHY